MNNISHFISLRLINYAASIYVAKSRRDDKRKRKEIEREKEERMKEKSGVK
jgi:hypothetical protein